jgi:tetratricopeptide (TPR) repeat protein
VDLSNRSYSETWFLKNTLKNEPPKPKAGRKGLQEWYSFLCVPPRRRLCGVNFFFRIEPNVRFRLSGGFVQERHRQSFVLVGFCAAGTTMYGLLGPKALWQFAGEMVIHFHEIILWRDKMSMKRFLFAILVSTSFADILDSGESAGTFLDRGLMFAARGDYEMAVEDFTEAIALNPNLSAAYILRGRALYAGAFKVLLVGENFSSIITGSMAGRPLSPAQRRVFGRVIADYSRAIRLYPNAPVAYMERGVMFDNIGEHDKAIADCSQAIRIDPYYAMAYYSRGNAYRHKGDKDKAIADLTQAIRLDPNFANAYTNRGVVYGNKKDYDRAIADYNQAIRINPDYADAYTSRL